MFSKNSENMELFIGIAFVLVLGAGLFSILAKDTLPGANTDPEVRVKDSGNSNLEYSGIKNASTGSLNTSPTGDSASENSDKNNSNSLNLSEDNMQTNQDTSVQKFSNPPELTIDTSTKYTAQINTSEGTINVDLFADRTPITVNNFVFLAKQGFYNGTRSHRIIRTFMVQFGDPLTKDKTLQNLWGTGDPGYKFADEEFEGTYDRGIVAMANSGPNTNGSQFFIMHQSNPLPPNYVIFGEVADDESLAILDKVANTPVTRGPSGEQSFPTKDVVIQNIEIIED